MSDQPQKALVPEEAKSDLVVAIAEAIHGAQFVVGNDRPLGARRTAQIALPAIEAAFAELTAPHAAEVEELRADLKLSEEARLAERAGRKEERSRADGAEQRLEEARAALVELIGLRRWLEGNAGRMPDERADAYRITKGSSHWDRAERIVAALDSLESREGGRLVGKLEEARDLCKQQTADAHAEWQRKMLAARAHFSNEADRLKKLGDEAEDWGDTQEAMLKSDAYRACAEHIEGFIPNLIGGGDAADHGRGNPPTQRQLVDQAASEGSGAASETPDRVHNRYLLDVEHDPLLGDRPAPGPSGDDEGGER